MSAEILRGPRQDTVHYLFTVEDPTDGSVSDADADPTFHVYEDTNNQNPLKVTSGTARPISGQTGLYAATFVGRHRSRLASNSPELDGQLPGGDKTTIDDASMNDFMYYRMSSPVISLGDTGEWDEDIREIGNIVDDNGTYWIFYSGHSGDYVQDEVYIGAAYSSDGITWTKIGKIIERSLEDPSVVEDNSGVWHLYAEDKAGGGDEIRKYHADSISGAWTDDGVVLEPDIGEWEENDVGSPVVWMEGTDWYMLYEGRGGGVRGSFGLATSADGETWAKEATNPVFEPNANDGEWDTYYVVPDDVVKIDGTYYALYHGYSLQWDDPKMGIAESTNLTSWTRHSANPFGGHNLGTMIGSIGSDHYIYSLLPDVDTIHHIPPEDIGDSGIYLLFPVERDQGSFINGCTYTVYATYEVGATALHQVIGRFRVNDSPGISKAVWEHDLDDYEATAASGVRAADMIAAVRAWGAGRLVATEDDIRVYGTDGSLIGEMSVDDADDVTDRGALS